MIADNKNEIEMPVKDDEVAENWTSEPRRTPQLVLEHCDFSAQWTCSNALKVLWDIYFAEKFWKISQNLVRLEARVQTVMKWRYFFEYNVDCIKFVVISLT